MGKSGARSWGMVGFTARLLDFVTQGRPCYVACADSPGPALLERRVLGGDPRVRKGRGKPAPDIYLLALELLDSAVDPSKKPIRADECLVLEDSVAGVETGRRAGMREKDIPAGMTGMFEEGDDWQPGEINDGWAESIPSLEHFDYKKYGINVPS
ncbi:hypothetical protein N8I77_005223 [Diaporthe amygdali]|uniref:Uncharacterized protein n=1 Tax=Phomopsis amygdali TaxID=1214568 RepID=A0AAD9W9G7_PHOAM|nr:hypothetical protein N8I77_005223 [Diaporthe amygdali]